MHTVSSATVLEVPPTIMGCCRDLVNYTFDSAYMMKMPFWLAGEYPSNDEFGGFERCLSDLFARDSKRSEGIYEALSRLADFELDLKADAQIVQPDLNDELKPASTKSSSDTTALRQYVLQIEQRLTGILVWGILQVRFDALHQLVVLTSICS